MRKHLVVMEFLFADDEWRKNPCFLYNALWRLLKKRGGRPRRVPDSPRFPRPVWSRTEARIEKWAQTSEDQQSKAPTSPPTFGAS